eukprot:355198-Chlamydomonas_euryale.AAC.6
MGKAKTKSQDCRQTHPLPPCPHAQDTKSRGCRKRSSQSWQRSSEAADPLTARSWSGDQHQCQQRVPPRPPHLLPPLCCF